MQFVYDAEAFGGGFPNVSFDIKGKKVFDPRDTNQTFGDESTYTYSDNPALIILDYITNTQYGLKAIEEECNLTTGAGGFKSAANTCDQTVTTDALGNSEKRYTANGFVDMSASGTGVLESILSSCIGDLTYASGS